MQRSVRKRRSHNSKRPLHLWMSWAWQRCTAKPSNVCMNIEGRCWPSILCPVHLALPFTSKRLQGFSAPSTTRRLLEAEPPALRHPHLMPTGCTPFATSSTCFSAGPLMGGALHMRRPPTLAGNLALFIGVHRGESTPPAFSFHSHYDPLFRAMLKNAFFIPRDGSRLMQRTACRPWSLGVCLPSETLAASARCKARPTCSVRDLFSAQS